MISKKYKGVWFYGLSGVGKTYASNFLKNHIRKFILLDGDQIRKHISFDLSHTLVDREIQIRRVYGMILLSLNSGVFPIASTVYMNKNIFLKIKRKKILPIQITRNFIKIKNRNNVYNFKNKNVVGKDIKMEQFLNKYSIDNNTTLADFKKKLLKVIND